MEMDDRIRMAVLDIIYRVTIQKESLEHLLTVHLKSLEFNNVIKAEIKARCLFVVYRNREGLVR